MPSTLRGVRGMGGWVLLLVMEEDGEWIGEGMLTKDWSLLSPVCVQSTKLSYGHSTVCPLACPFPQSFKLLRFQQQTGLSVV